MELTQNQLEAVRVATNNRRAIITGGAGSGKTTVIKSIIAELYKNGGDDEVICLAAPTGKAAARVTEATGHLASTVHSACGIFPVDNSDDVGRAPYVPPAALATTLIIDEASMNDDALLAAACKTVRPDTRVILVGDPNQLPPVGAGYPFRDLIASKRVPHVHLDKVHRQAGVLLENCYQILTGDHSGLVNDPGKGNRVEAPWGFIESADDSIGDHLSRLFTGDICNDTFGVPPEELLVLTPVNKGDCGRVSLNRIAQAAYHWSRGRSVPTYVNETENDKFLPGDRVIWTQNDKGLGLVNGDTGVVREVGSTQCVVEWDGIGKKTVTPGQTLRLAWVLTCHKAQGSQYKKVLVIQASKHCNRYLNGIINRSWVYTAATRSQQATWFLGSSKAFRTHVETEAVDTRNTILEVIL